MVSDVVCNCNSKMTGKREKKQGRNGYLEQGRCVDGIFVFWRRGWIILGYKCFGFTNVALRVERDSRERRARERRRTTRYTCNFSLRVRTRTGFFFFTTATFIATGSSAATASTTASAVL